MITIKKQPEIDRMRAAGAITADILRLMRDMIKPGVDTLTLDEAAEELVIRSSAKPAFKGYRVPGIRRPFPATICVSINDEIVHGIPDRSRRLEEGDIVSIDTGAIKDGYYGDAACTYAVGGISPERERLLNITLNALHAAMAVVRQGATVGDIGSAVESIVSSAGCGLVRDYSGHGIGKKLHEAPQIPNYGRAGTGMVLKSGMTICIEPMVMSGGEAVRSLADEWTVATEDGSDAAHFENTLLVTEDGVEVLTPWE